MPWSACLYLSSGRPSTAISWAAPRPRATNGRVIGGGHAVGLESEAVIWIDRQPHYLKDYLRRNGVPRAFDGWVNTGSITGISRDGRVEVGFGAGPEDFTGYVVVLPAPGDEK